MKGLELATLIIVSLVLFRDIVVTGDINEGLIMGGLSLLAVIAGFYQKSKSYFFVGAGDLLLNILFQTRAFWRSVPWWAYLSVAGITLITIASITEMQKNKDNGKGIKISLRNLFAKLKEWK